MLISNNVIALKCLYSAEASALFLVVIVQDIVLCVKGRLLLLVNVMEDIVLCKGQARAGCCVIAERGSLLTVEQHHVRMGLAATSVLEGSACLIDFSRLHF